MLEGSSRCLRGRKIVCFGYLVQRNLWRLQSTLAQPPSPPCKNKHHFSKFDNFSPADVKFQKQKHKTISLAIPSTGEKKLKKIKAPKTHLIFATKCSQECEYLCLAFHPLYSWYVAKESSLEGAVVGYVEKNSNNTAKWRWSFSSSIPNPGHK